MLRSSKLVLLWEKHVFDATLTDNISVSDSVRLY